MFPVCATKPDRIKKLTEPTQWLKEVNEPNNLYIWLTI